MKNILSVKETAKIMGIHEHTVRKLIKNGKLEAYRTAGKFLVNYLSIPAFMRNKK